MMLCFWCSQEKREAVPQDNPLYEPCHTCGVAMGKGLTVVEIWTTPSSTSHVGLRLGPDSVVYPTGLWASVNSDWLSHRLDTINRDLNMISEGGHCFVSPEVWDLLAFARPTVAKAT